MSLIDRQQIEDIIFDYSICLDKGDLDGLCSLLEHCELDVQLTKNDRMVMRGSREIRKWIDDNVVLYEDGTPKTSHVNSNVRIWMSDDGQSARANTHLTVFQKVKTGDVRTLQPIIIGYYDDEFRIIDGRWWMARRAESVISAGNMSGHGAHVPA